MKITHPFFFMEAVFMAAGCRLTTSATPPSQVSHCSGHSSCRASHLSFQGTWRGGEVPEETQWLCQAGTCHHFPLSLKSLCSARERAGKPLCHAFIIRNCASYRILNADFERVIYIKYRTILRNPSTFQLILLWFETKKNTFSGKSILGLFLLKATSS